SGDQRRLLVNESWQSFASTPDSYMSLLDEKYKTTTLETLSLISYAEGRTYMHDVLLRDTDQMSMAHALEIRVPLLDHKLVEYLFMLPGACKLHDHQSKPLLTYSLSSDIPDECVNRPKHGFELPFAIWLKKSLKSEVQASFL